MQPVIMCFATNIDSLNNHPMQRECTKIDWTSVGAFLWGRIVSKWLVSICIYEDTKPFKTPIASHVFTFVTSDVQQIQDTVNDWMESVESMIAEMD